MVDRRDIVSGLAARLRLGLASMLVVASWFSSYFPVNVVTVFLLRCVGAQLGKGVAVHHGLLLRGVRKLRIGNDVYISENVTMDARGGLEIGDSSSIGAGVQIWSAQHDYRTVDFAFESAPVVIGHHSWVSSRAIILPGVTIGDGAVIGAGSVVTKSVAPWTVVGGNPARQLASRPVVDRYLLNARRNKIWWY